VRILVALPVLLARLDDDPGNLIVEAAAALRSSEAFPALLASSARADSSMNRARPSWTTSRAPAHPSATEENGGRVAAGRAPWLCSVGAADPRE
jgi:hypothetical protein